MVNGIIYKKRQQMAYSTGCQGLRMTLWRASMCLKTIGVPFLQTMWATMLLPIMEKSLPIFVLNSDQFQVNNLHYSHN